MLKNILILILLLTTFMSNAQDVNAISFPVKIEGKDLKNPFVGGLNAPQIYTIDLNEDGTKDVIIMDRDGGVMIPYLRTSTGVGIDLTYAPEYKTSFPDIQEWFKIRDFNGDGIGDIFCYPKSRAPGIEVRKGKYVNGVISFETIEFNEISQFPNVIPIPASTGSAQLYVGSNDQPEIIDIDNDGDMDVVTFDGAGSYLHYWKNRVIEDGLSIDTFSMRLEESCWGKFYEAETSQEVVLSTDSDACATPFDEPFVEERHAGSCVTLIDEDGNGTWDVLLGDLSNRNINLLINTGDNESGHITSQDNLFPSYDVPIDMDIFNATFYDDVDNDGKRDLIAAPNNLGNNTENYRVLWYYTNVGSDSNPLFEFRKDDLLVEEMVDLGASSAPTFTDYNQDGLLDIVVGSLGRYQNTENKDSRLYLFENKGTLTQPAFELVDENYNNFSQFAENGAFFHPTFGDLDGDGDIDMLVGDSGGHLYYSENIAGPGLPYEFTNTITEFMGIRPGNNVRVSIADLNQDGLGDIITGEKNNNSNGSGGIGALIYFPNIGTVGNPVFEGEETEAPNIMAFGDVNTQTIFDPSAMSAPYFYLDNNEYKLFVGSRSGKVDIYSNILGNLNGSFTLESEDYGEIRDGENTSLAVADLNGDNKLEMIIGNERGGLTLYGTEILADANVNTDGTHNNDVSIGLFPNPTRGIMSLKSDINLSNTTYQIFNVDGKVVLEDVIGIDGKIDISDAPQGSYLIKILLPHTTVCKKVVKI